MLIVLHNHCMIPQTVLDVPAELALGGKLFSLAQPPLGKYDLEELNKEVEDRLRPFRCLTIVPIRIHTPAPVERTDGWVYYVTEETVEHLPYFAGASKTLPLQEV